jgi:hypothetical protein
MARLTRDILLPCLVEGVYILRHLTRRMPDLTPGFAGEYKGRRLCDVR